jgi:predicted ATPase/class 3 adenylate cyclase/Tfp pilus assembly protein PilF
MITGVLQRNLPSGTVTFLFTDVEGSTKLLHKLGTERYAEKLAEHRRVVREACAAQRGVEVDTQGDAFFVAFPTARGAVEAARSITEELASSPIALRIGLHTGTPLVTEEGYVGGDVHFAARVAASAHGGQIVVSKATRALLDEGDSLVDLGEHRLKDMPEPVPIFQLGERQFPPLRTISNTNLPRPASSFVGRERELSEVLARIADGARLVTLSGPGGSGKTRLALEAAATLVPKYKAGVFWVGLASLREAALVSETIAQTLGAKGGLADHVGEREMLVLLDNVEQVIEVAPELSELLASCANLTLLVTSRELLRVQGEVEYPVPPLAEGEAISLFCERAQATASAEIGELCRRLDSLPLAVELAAARTTALSVEQILERLAQRLDLFKGGRDADLRQQTLRATIAWSYELLTPEEQQLVGRIAVFAGGYTLDAAEEVADANIDILQSLVEKSLARFTNQRYWMLETIREFALERLADLGDAEQVRQRHAGYYLRLAEQTEAEARGPAEEQWLGRLMNEQENFRVALAWSLETQDGETALRLTGALHPFWYHAGFLLEGRRWAERALAMAGPAATAERAKALATAGEFAGLTGDLKLAKSYLEESISLYQGLGEHGALPAAYTQLGHIAVHQADYELAQSFYQRSLEHESSVAWHTPAVAFNNIGWASLMKGDLAKAQEAFEKGYAQAKHGKSGLTEIALLQNLAWVALLADDVARSQRLTRESLKLLARFTDPQLVCEALELALRLTASREPRKAARLEGAAAGQRASLGIDDAQLERLAPKERYLEQARACLDPGEWDAQWQAGHLLAPGETIEYALSVLGSEIEAAEPRPLSGDALHARIPQGRER